MFLNQRYPLNRFCVVSVDYPPSCTAPRAPTLKFRMLVAVLKFQAFLKGDDWNGEVFIYLPLLALSFEALASYELFIHGVDESVGLRYSFVDKVESHGCIVKIHLGHDLCSHVAIEPAFKLHVHLSWMK